MLHQRLLCLRERGCHRVRLHRDEADWLRHCAAPMVHVELTPQRGVYQVKVGGYVGYLVTPRRLIQLHSKLPADNLAWMLGMQPGPEVASDPNVAPDVCLTSLPTLEGIVRLFAQRFEAVGRRGLYTEYRQTPHQGPILRGPLNLSAQVREPRPDRLHSQPDERTADLPCNRVPVALANRLLGLPWSAPTQAMLRSARDWWGGVNGEAATWPETIPPGYEELFEVCNWLRAHFGHDSASVVFSLSHVFERHVARCLKGESQYSFSPCPKLTLRPDVTLLHRAMPC
ncbi:MAG: hypothetical protein SNJ75_17415, partial [Gemmataceae bacterium]